jgi:hypothetical protein
MALYRLIYKSISTEPFTAEFLQSLEGSSKKNNAALDVTGILIGTKSNFLQVLEGERKNVNTVFKKICQDPRHTEIELISYTRIFQQEFPDWSMKCISTGIMGRIVTEQLKKKFGENNSDLELPSDGDKAFALLFDLAFLQKSGAI